MVIYGDASNWFAAYGFWLFKIYGHKNVRLLNGGRASWLNDAGAPLTHRRAKLRHPVTRCAQVDLSLRANAPEVLTASRQERGRWWMSEARIEFTGKVIAPPGMSETAQRGGHVPGAASIPWGTAVNTETGFFKSPDELRSIYVEQKKLDPKKATIAYCRIGERCSHTWFVLTYLLGFPKVRELRRELDGVREPHRRTDREALSQPHHRHPTPRVSRPLKEGPKCVWPVAVSSIS